MYFIFCYVVILFLGACITPPHLSMVTEYMEMGSLYYLIHMSGQKKKLSWRRRLKIIRDICRYDLFSLQNNYTLYSSVWYFFKKDSLWSTDDMYDW